MIKEKAMISARIDPKIKKLADKWCKTNGLVISKFIEDAILDKLEENIDLSEIEKLRREPTKPLRDVLKDMI